MSKLAEAIYGRYGYDFRGYAEAGFGRRVRRAVGLLGAGDEAELVRRALADPAFFARLLPELTVTVTELFRDPEQLSRLRAVAVPYLRTYPEVKIWVAGCASGEEAYSLAILLDEAGLLERSTIYATDINPVALSRAREGIVSLARVKEATPRHYAAGGTGSLSNYFTVRYGAGLLLPRLRDACVFAEHNLASDAAFSEMQLILCRNTLIYFKRELHQRALSLFQASLAPGGFLCLGSRESLATYSHAAAFEHAEADVKLYRKKAAP